MADLSYREQLANIKTMGPKDLTDLEQTIVKAFDDAEALDDLDAMGAAANALDEVRAAQADTNNAAATEEAQVGTEQLGAPNNTEGNAQNADANASAAAPLPVAASAKERRDARDAQIAKTAATAAVEAVTAAITAGTLPAALKEYEFKKKDPVTADAAPDDEDDDPEGGMTASSTEKENEMPIEQVDIPEDRQPLVASSLSTILAGADIPQRAAGSEFGNYMEVNEAFASRLESLRGSGRGGDGEKVIVASVKSTVDSDRQLETGADADNWRKVDEVVRAMKEMRPTALVASGGYCAPLETKYDIFGVGVTDRPVRDSLAGFQATRGGIRYVSPPVLSSYSSAVGLWTAANDANPSSPATKPFMTVACASEVTATADAVTLELQFGNLMTRAYPELVARNNELGLIYQARFAEQTLLSKISALSTAVSSTFTLGTARDFLLAVGKAGAAYRHRHRMNVNDTLRVMAPSWQLEAMREDLTRGYPGDQIEWADSQINAALAARSINITWYIDDSQFTGVQAAGALNDFPATIKWYIFAEGTFLFLDGGTLDLGIVRDSTLVGTNDYRMFVETFEGVAKVGIESLAVTTTTHVNGAIIGTVASS